jgi:hypothetical protein
MVLSFNQPVFIPWGGFFARLLAADRMVLLDDTLFARGFTFVNRNRIKGPDGQVWLTVPIKKKGRGRQKIRDLEIYQKPYWAGKFGQTLRHSYGKSVFFEVLHELLMRLIRTDDPRFWPMVGDLLECLRHQLEVKTPFLLQSEIGIEARGIELLIRIARKLGADEIILPFPASRRLDWRPIVEAGIGVRFLKFVSPVYPQFWGEFTANLSVLDLLFCIGPAGRRLLEKSFTLVAL